LRIGVPNIVFLMIKRHSKVTCLKRILFVISIYRRTKKK